MRILNKYRLQGMVPYIDATEIPAVVVMGWVEGPTLKQAVESHYVDQWKTRLHIASTLAEIIRRAHSLLERVLHRDIRPANIMLKGYYTDPDSFEVVVLDFDLSWHQGASERSVIYGATTRLSGARTVAEHPWSNNSPRICGFLWYWYDNVLFGG